MHNASLLRITPPLREPMRTLRLASILVVLASCGDSGAHPTGPVRVQRTETAEVPAHAWVCAAEFAALDGAFRAQVAPGSLYLEFRSGPCDTAGSLLSSSSVGAMTLTLRSFGVYHVQLGNPTDSTVRYSLELDYSAPSV